jgi:hypothetical protein
MCRLLRTQKKPPTMERHRRVLGSSTAQTGIGTMSMLPYGRFHFLPCFVKDGAVLLHADAGGQYGEDVSYYKHRHSYAGQGASRSWTGLLLLLISDAGRHLVATILVRARRPPTTSPTEYQVLLHYEYCFQVFDRRLELLLASASASGTSRQIQAHPGTHGL